MADSLGTLLSQAANEPIRIERTLLKSQVVDLLRTAIIFGRIPPGTPLGERDLATALHVSRVPIREALQELEKEGLVISTASNRRCVIELTERDIRELYEVRLRLETLAVERAARNTTPEHRDQLNAAMETMEQAFRDHNLEAFPHADIELHRAIWQQAGNRHLQAMLNSMAGQLFMVVSRHSQLYDWAEVIDLHRDLITHINAGDVEAACVSIAAHMQNSLERALHAFGTPPSETP
jgi:DNA-binding GntR family transcriptional regulator